MGPRSRLPSPPCIYVSHEHIISFNNEGVKAKFGANPVGCQLSETSSWAEKQAFPKIPPLTVDEWSGINPTHPHT